jgi:hypothetical protein
MNELTVQDIANAIAVIDICVKRGAIEGSELSAVGSVRDKLSKYIEEKNVKLEQETGNSASE